MICMLVVGMTAMAQSLDEVFTKYKANPSAEYVTIGKDMINMMLSMAASAELSDEDRKQMELFKDIDNMTTLTIPDMDEAKAETFLNDVRNALKKGYELKEMNDTEDNVVIASKKNKKKDKYASEIVIAACSGNEAVLMLITGKLDQENLGSLMSLGK